MYIRPFILSRALLVLFTIPMLVFGGENVQPTTCQDYPNWADSAGKKCFSYQKWGWCTPTGGQGATWLSSWGEFHSYSVRGVDATKACCCCGGGIIVDNSHGTITSPPTVAPTSTPAPAETQSPVTPAAEPTATPTSVEPSPTTPSSVPPQEPGETPPPVSPGIPVPEPTPSPAAPGPAVPDASPAPVAPETTPSPVSTPPPSPAPTSNTTLAPTASPTTNTTLLPTASPTPVVPVLAPKEGSYPCIDRPVEWLDSWRFNCSTYVEQQWCSPNGSYGPGWNTSAWGTFDDYAANGVNASQACCGCGGGRTDGCQDSPKGWADSYGYSCLVYVQDQWCDVNGAYGNGWKFYWLTFQRYAVNGVDARKGCCGCGGGTDPAAIIRSIIVKTSISGVVLIVIGCIIFAAYIILCTRRPEPPKEHVRIPSSGGGYHAIPTIQEVQGNRCIIA